MAKSHQESQDDDGVPKLLHERRVQCSSCLVIGLMALLLGVACPPLLVFASQSAAATVVEERSLEGEKECLLPEEDNAPLYPCTQEFLNDYWHDAPARGFHIVCFSRPSNNKDDTLSLELYRNGMKSQQETIQDEETRWEDLKWDDLKQVLETKLRLQPSNANFQPYALFSPEGRRLVDGNQHDDEQGTLAQRLLHHGVALVYQGGQFLWPGVRPGFERKNVALYSVMPEGIPEDASRERNVTIVTLSLSPLVVSVHGFLSDEECTHIQHVAEPDIEYSEVVLMDHDAGRPASDFRTSQSTFVSSRRDATLRDLDNRVASLSRLPRNHQEDVQVLRYGLTEKYDHHTDYFDPELYRNDARTLHTIKNGARNRLATVFWYLSTVSEGGETAFPRANGHVPRDMQDCSGGLLVKPERGKVIIFYSLLMTGEGDPNSLHGACPVKNGVKWAANKWIWNEPMHYVM